MKTLFIIDDNPDDLDLFCRAAHSVEECVKCIECGDPFMARQMMLLMKIPDIVFIETDMHNYSGSGLLKTLRKERVLDGLPIAMMSTKVNNVSTAMLKLLGAQFVLRKPSSLRGYIQMIHQTISKLPLVYLTWIATLRLSGESFY